jgi:hypothetical protein
MGKTIHCKDVEFECDGIVRAGTEEEVLQMAAWQEKEVVQRFKHAMLHWPITKESTPKQTKTKPIRSYLSP